MLGRLLSLDGVVPVGNHGSGDHASGSGSGRDESDPRSAEDAAAIAACEEVVDLYYGANGDPTGGVASVHSNLFVDHAATSARYYAHGTELDLQQTPEALRHAGVTGCVVWNGAVVLSAAMEAWCSDGTFSLLGRRVLELGAGSGLLAASMALQGADVVATEQAERLTLLRKNMASNCICSATTTTTATALAARKKRDKKARRKAHKFAGAGTEAGGASVEPAPGEAEGSDAAAVAEPAGAPELSPAATDEVAAQKKEASVQTRESRGYEFPKGGRVRVSELDWFDHATLPPDDVFAPGGSWAFHNLGSYVSYDPTKYHTRLRPPHSISFPLLITQDARNLRSAVTVGPPTTIPRTSF